VRDWPANRKAGDVRGLGMEWNGEVSHLKEVLAEVRKDNNMYKRAIERLEDSSRPKNQGTICKAMPVSSMYEMAPPFKTAELLMKKNLE
jgi:hypothetical protein